MKNDTIVRKILKPKINNLIDITFYEYIEDTDLYNICIKENSTNNIKLNNITIDSYKFININFNNIELSNVSLVDVVFEHCNLTRADIYNIDNIKVDVNSIKGVIVNSYQAIMIISLLGIEVKD